MAFAQRAQRPHPDHRHGRSSKGNARAPFGNVGAERPSRLGIHRHLLLLSDRLGTLDILPPVTLRTGGVERRDEPADRLAPFIALDMLSHRDPLLHGARRSDQPASACLHGHGDRGNGGTCCHRLYRQPLADASRRLYCSSRPYSLAACVLEPTYPLSGWNWSGKRHRFHCFNRQSGKFFAPQIKNWADVAMGNHDAGFYTLAALCGITILLLASVGKTFPGERPTTVK